MAAQCNLVDLHRFADHHIGRKPNAKRSSVMADLASQLLGVGLITLPSSGLRRRLQRSAEGDEGEGAFGP
jgi:hypothetical protein